MPGNGNGHPDAHTTGMISLPVALLRDAKAKPLQGERAACIDLQVRIAIDATTREAAGALLELYESGAPVAITLKLTRRSAAGIRRSAG